MKDRKQVVLMPSDVSSRVGFFDRFAGMAATLASRAPFFAMCLVLVFTWLAQGLILVFSRGSLSPFLEAQYQLEINTTTTIITFLLVALLQNSQTRNDQATQHKLNAIADGLADLMEHMAAQFTDTDIEEDMKELRAAVGLENREGTSRSNDGRGLTGHHGTREGTMEETTGNEGNELRDEDMSTEVPGAAPSKETGPRDTDGTDGDGKDADGTDGDATDGTDGDGTDADGTDTATS